MLDRVEPKARIFLKKIMKTIFVGLFWMMLQVLLGIFFEMGFVEKNITMINVIFYVQLTLTLSLLIYFYYSLWKHLLLGGKNPES
jgi:hypothetical protein